ncbi:MAG: D,D-heptose 1,7-bisphosphate phosphatase [Candidatus Omnitrophica bacterium CG_4_10_14_0_2_um_filter_44_9]|nr:MAG: D,D-heptose 1,7-bisphosphate phosphatase [Candidatus Omnitrophica bacterium CG_4_10_14_0_8_um_filter_44_12]PIZ83373.1 MAG: D,D-heptose 1,7-bisphosphate phosphatase [Candidatus Omnitrophica bacterium CG_4_10_14_0_2_um_filter_44_9]
MKKIQKVIFLDRDGVINKYPGDKKYVTSLKGFKFLPGALNAIRSLTRAGYALYCISNQAGVSKGLYSKKTLKKITELMLSGIRENGGKIKILYCLHTSEMNCACRKPKIGLLKKATKGKKTDLKNSFFIGDSLLDVKAGKLFGCKTVLVLSGREKLKNTPNWYVSPDFVAKSLSTAAINILKNKYERA